MEPESQEDLVSREKKKEENYAKVGFERGSLCISRI